MDENQLRAILARNPQLTVNDPDRGKVPTPEPERRTANALDTVAAGKEESLGRPTVSFTFYRTRLLDPDGLNPKDLLDGLVKAGILRDDSEKDITLLPPRQTKVAHRTDERTEIVITYADP